MQTSPENRGGKNKVDCLSSLSDAIAVALEMKFVVDLGSTLHGDKYGP